MMTEIACRKKQPKCTIDWGFFKTIPIMEIIDLLGIKTKNDRRNIYITCPNPEHEDKNPSAKIDITENRYYCFVCNKGGSVLDLVQNALNLDNIRDAAIYLSNYYPGGISFEDEELEDDFLKPPYISYAFLKEIGLKKNPLSIVTVRAIMQTEPNGVPKVSDPINFALDVSEGVELIIDKLAEYIQSKKDYTEGIYKEFPLLKMNKDVKNYIYNETRNKIKEAERLLLEYREYYRELAEFIPELDLE